MQNTFRFLTLAAALLVAVPASQTHAAIDYVTWYGNVNVQFDDVTGPPHQVKLFGNGGSNLFSRDGGVVTGTNPSQTNTYGNANDGGGEFRVQTAAGDEIFYTVDHDNDPITDVITWVYKTFCIEQGEHFGYDSPYDVSIDPVAYYGINGGQTEDDGYGHDADPLSDETRLLYGLYFLGKLDDYVSLGFTYTDDASATQLQRAIWKLEDDSVTLTGGSIGEKLYNFARHDDQADLRGDYHDLVDVLNLWDPAAVSGQDNFQYKKQSQLVFKVDLGGGSGVVPEPGSMVLWALGMVASAGIGWRRRKVAAS